MSTLPTLNTFKVEQNLATTVDLLERAAQLIVDLQEDEDNEYGPVVEAWFVTYRELTRS